MSQHRFDEGVTVLKNNGIKMTPQRAAILEYLANSESHPTADDIYKALTSKLPSMTNATIYNNLKCFKKYGIINELTFGQFSSRYEWKTSFHYHVVCTSCSKMCDFNYPRLKDVEQFVEKRLDFNVTRHFFEVHGICSDCNKKTNPYENEVDECRNMSPLKIFITNSEVKEVDIEDHKKVVLNYSCDKSFTVTQTSTTKPL